jgi:hypothetical protein
MKEILGYLRSYLFSVNRWALLFTTLLVAVAVALNYTLHLETAINALPSWPLRVTGFFLLFAFLFSASWLLQFVAPGSQLPHNRLFFLLVLAAPLVFALKITFSEVTLQLTGSIAEPWQSYWLRVLDWPLKCVLVLVLTGLIWRLARLEKPLAGLQAKGFNAVPYLVLLLCMIPLIAFAATRPDFLRMYPKVQRISFLNDHTSPVWPWKLLYELSYGLDFFTIELFFRGFLVLAFAKLAGKDAILPIAAFYCSIHFGKPLFECITSYIGGTILGVIVYHTRSIWGGLMVHLGIAWLMELAGYMGHFYQDV